jgi:hypothetical protein
MLTFRDGVWSNVDIVLWDPIFSEEHRLQAAAIVATGIKNGLSVQAATAEAERILYERMYLISREQHGAPKDKEEKDSVKKEAGGRGGAGAVRNR